MSVHEKILAYMQKRKRKPSKKLVYSFSTLSHETMPSSLYYTRLGLLLALAVEEGVINADRGLDRIENFIAKQLVKPSVDSEEDSQVPKLTATCAIPLVCASCGTTFAVISRKLTLPAIAFTTILFGKFPRRLTKLCGIQDYPSEVTSITVADEGRLTCIRMEGMPFPPTSGVESVALAMSYFADKGWDVKKYADLEVFWAKHSKTDTNGGEHHGENEGEATDEGGNGEE